MPDRFKFDVLRDMHKSNAFLPAPCSMGTDFSGIVESVGKGVTRFRTGDEVFGSLNLEILQKIADLEAGRRTKGKAVIIVD